MNGIPKKEDTTQAKLTKTCSLFRGRANGARYGLTFQQITQVNQDKLPNNLHHQQPSQLLIICDTPG
ncbi:21677_t:CDS:2 [Racocetra persica]|uniref:21677_t:CDS:1 n=1 Tax=Racocetra persica TaxID=160502 RepID=A0ACA9L2R2_9GLOM|nr:21677_t:CDS:2 [Racocetra persica]